LQGMDKGIADYVSSFDGFEAQAAAFGEVAEFYKNADDIVLAVDSMGLKLGTTAEELAETYQHAGSFLKSLPADEALEQAKNNAQDTKAALFMLGTQFKETGETVTQAVSRVIAEFAAVKTATDNMGLSLNGTAQDMIAWSDEIIKAAGGIQEFGSKAEFAYQNFFTEEERKAALMQRATATVQQYNSAFGGIDITSRKAWRTILDGIDLTTEAGRKQYVALLKRSTLLHKTRQVVLIIYQAQ